MRSFFNCFRFNRRFFLIGCSVILFQVTARADVFTYGDFSGNTSEFNNVQESTSTSYELFDAPEVAGDQLLFFPTAFASYSEDGNPTLVQSILDIDIESKTGYHIETIRIDEYGDYILGGSGTDQTTAHIYTYLQLFDTASGTFLLDSDQYTYTLSSEEDTSGIFHTIVEIELETAATSISLRLQNNLNTTSEDGTNAAIQKKGVSNSPAVTISINPTPIPGGEWLLISGIIGIFSIRKKHRPDSARCIDIPR